MKWIFLLLTLPFFSIEAGTARQASFIPPQGWREADTKMLPPSVKYMVVGQGEHELPPSINLGYEVYSGSVNDYLKIVKELNTSQGDSWKDLGTIQTKNGPGSLSQADVKTNWGVIRQMYLIYKDQGVIYILTAAALRDEFPKFYKSFFQTLESFTVTDVPEKIG